MSFESDLFTRLSALASGDVFPVLAPTGTTGPYIVFTLVDETQPFDLSGPSGLRRHGVTFDCYATTYAEARSTLEQVIGAITPAGNDMTCAALSSATSYYSTTEQLYGLTVEAGFWSPGLGVIIVTVLVSRTDGVVLEHSNGDVINA